MTPEALITLANLGAPRRPSRARERLTEAALPDVSTADRQVGGLIARPVTQADLRGLRHLQRVAAQAADALLSGEIPVCSELNALAGGSRGRTELIITKGELRQQVTWDDSSAVAGLARRLIGELAALEPSRLRRCARTQCGLVFYDATRSRTRRWHAEDPCGWRERQQARRHR